MFFFLENIQWKNPLIAKNEKTYLSHGGKGSGWFRSNGHVPGSRGGKQKSDEQKIKDAMNGEYPDGTRFYYGKDGKVHAWNPNGRVSGESLNLNRAYGGMEDYANDFYDEEGNFHRHYNTIDKKTGKMGTGELVKPEETVRREKLYSDVAKAKNPIDMGKAFVDFALASVNKFLKSIFK